MTIRPATAADLSTMVRIKHDAGLAAWQHILPPEVIEELPFPARWEAAIDSHEPRVGVLLAELDRRVVGFAITRPSGDDDALPGTGELDAFYADPSAWGAGAGRALLAGCGGRAAGGGLPRRDALDRGAEPSAAPHLRDGRVAPRRRGAATVARRRRVQ